MLFSDIVGQEKVKERLIQLVRENRVPHANLFVGPPGAGKLPLAVAFAQYIMCENRGKSDSCGVCPSCRKVAKLVHPDLHFVFPTKTKEKSDEGADENSEKPDDTISTWRSAIIANPYFGENDWYEMIGMENKQGIISTATASEIIRKLGLKSFENEFKVIIIWLPERMNNQAANKLLKLIEEPPEKTIFLLVSENPTHILKTILSRTQQVMVPPINRESVALALHGKYNLSPELAHDISRIANGNFYEAIRLKDQESNYFFTSYRKLMRLCYSKNVLGLLDWVDETASLGREDLKHLLVYSLRLTRETLVLNMGVEEVSYLMGEEEAFCHDFSPFITTNNVFSITDELVTAFECITQNGNPTVVLTHMTMRMVKLIPNKKAA